MDVASWLKTIANSKLVVTDSFHTVCFAIIFRRSFIAISSTKRGKSRLLGILEPLGLQHRLIDWDAPSMGPLPGVLVRLANSPTYSGEEDSKLELLIGASAAWLKQAVKCQVSRKKSVISYSKMRVLWEKIPCRLFAYWPLWQTMVRVTRCILLWKPGKKQALSALKSQLRRIFRK